jgi:lipopolysaccharide transport system permease protein
LSTTLKPAMPDAGSDRDASFGHGQVTEISDSSRSLRADLRELWRYRDLLWMLTSRDITVRYKQSALGIAWAVIQPVILMIVFTVVFGRFAKMPSDGIPYPLFVLSALLPWQYFSRSLAGSSGSLVASNALVSKVYFPRLILPLSKTFSGLIDFAIGFVLLGLIMAWYGVAPGWQIVLLPLFIAGAMATALAVGLWLSAINVRYRDVGLVVPFLVQIWMYMSPVAYSSSVVPERWHWLYSLNPIVGVVEGFRWALVGRAPPDPLALLVSLTAVVLLFVGGLIHFRRTERTFADII